MSESKYEMSPVGFITSCFKFKNGIPRQSLLCPEAKAILTIKKSIFNNPEHSVIGLSEFSYVWIIFIFHKNEQRNSIRAKVHPPRLNGLSTGVFSTRSPHRPCPLGLSLVRLERVEGSSLYLSGIDLLDGTPVLDIKPYIPVYDVPPSLTSDSLKHDDAPSKTTSDKNPATIPVAEDSTKNTCDVASYLHKPSKQLEVLFTERSLADLKTFHKSEGDHIECERCLQSVDSQVEAKNSIIAILQNDPRSVYRRQKCSDRLYYFSINNLHITCWFDGDIAEVLKIKPTELQIEN